MFFLPGAPDVRILSCSEFCKKLNLSLRSLVTGVLNNSNPQQMGALESKNWHVPQDKAQEYYCERRFMAVQVRSATEPSSSRAVAYRRWQGCWTVAGFALLIPFSQTTARLPYLLLWEEPPSGWSLSRPLCAGALFRHRWCCLHRHPPTARHTENGYLKVHSPPWPVSWLLELYS